MTETTKIIATSMLTLGSGVALFAVSQLATEVFLRPLSEFRKIVGEIGFSLVFHANIIASARYEDAPEKCRDASLELRRLSARLRATADSIWCYDIFENTGIVPKRKDVSEAASLLIRLSNITGSPGHWTLKYEDKQKVGKLLNLDLG